MPSWPSVGTRIVFMPIVALPCCFDNRRWRGRVYRTRRFAPPHSGIGRRDRLAFREQNAYARSAGAHILWLHRAIKSRFARNETRRRVLLAPARHVVRSLTDDAGDPTGRRRDARVDAVLEPPRAALAPA